MFADVVRKTKKVAIFLFVGRKKLLEEIKPQQNGEISDKFRE